MRKSRVRLPPSVSPQFTVFLNGVRQEAGTDYHVDDDTLVFERPSSCKGPDTRGSSRHPFAFSAVAAAATGGEP